MKNYIYYNLYVFEMNLKNSLVILFTIFSLTVLAQNEDSCQCKLMYGNMLHPTLVTFHNDSLVSYQYASLPNDSVYKILGTASAESIFKIKNYKWYKSTRTYYYNKEGIGEKINGEFYIFHSFKLLDIGMKYSSYKISFSETYNDSVLYKDAYEIESHYKFNSTICNCFDSDRYMYNGDFKKLDLNRKSLELINTTDSLDSKDKNIFVWADACTFGVVRTCYLTGIGPVSIGIMDNQYNSDNYKVPVVFLDSKCKEFFEKQLNLEIQLER